MFGMPKPPEAVAEAIPSREAVQQMFRDLIGWEFEVVQHLEDEHGPYYFEAKVQGEKSGDYFEYVYTRKGTFEVYGSRMVSTESDIGMVRYEDSVPISGGVVARFVDGKWQRQV